jgi:hypothetical protein
MNPNHLIFSDVGPEGNRGDMTEQRLLATTFEKGNQQ